MTTIKAEVPDLLVPRQSLRTSEISLTKPYCILA